MRHKGDKNNSTSSNLLYDNGWIMSANNIYFICIALPKKGNGQNSNWKKRLYVFTVSDKTCLDVSLL